MRGRASFLPLLISLAIFGYGLFQFATTPDRREDIRPERRPPPRGDVRRRMPRPGSLIPPPALPPDGLKPWRPGPSTGRPLPPPSARDPAILVKIPAEKRSSSGTAFAIDNRGTWMTARHVVDSCRRIYVLTGARRGLRVSSVYSDRNADIAIIRTSRGAPPMRFSAGALSRGQQGFQFGFPKGQPGDVSARLIGRRVMRSVGRYRIAEPVIAWAEVHRVPDTYHGLGGISGGPATNAAGDIVGVTVAGSKRRGRVYTTAPVSVRRALAKAGTTARPARSTGTAGLTTTNFADHGRRLRRQLTVAKVVCLVSRRRSSSPRRPAIGGSGGGG